MAIKEQTIDGIGVVRFQKRRGTSSVRINIQGHSVRVTMPYWVSYKEAERFVLSRREWVNTHRKQKLILAHGALIGKNYTLHVLQQDCLKPKTRVLNDVINVMLPLSYDVDSEASQIIIEKACERALLREAKQLLTPRINDLAYEHGFEFADLSFKKLKRRWGSCDTHKNIVLNIFLTQLSWDYIDYVILHELTHTKHLNHSAAFWKALIELLPNAKELRKQIHQFNPQLLPR